jgi:2-C-methyl-D-erythritol 2,4-cyclodiphosphate synthase
MRIGQGFDVHALVPGRRLVIGGVEIPMTRGLAGHSDADVLLHAICDALLGAAALGDIGRHFPDSDARYKGIDSRELLRHVAALLKEKGLAVVNVDATIVAQAPRMAPHVARMVANIAGRPRRRARGGEREGDDHRGPGLHRPRRGNRGAGDLPDRVGARTALR